MTTKKQFEKDRNAKLVGGLMPCYYCDPPLEFGSYMEKVNHRESVHKIPRGKSDDHKITKGDPDWEDPEYFKSLIRILNTTTNLQQKAHIRKILDDKGIEFKEVE